LTSATLNRPAPQNVSRLSLTQRRRQNNPTQPAPEVISIE
jgi:hypothetical protein